MNPTYLKHPDHGSHVVYDVSELKKHQAIGWVLWDHQPDGGVMPEKVAAAETDTSVSAAPEKRKPGRPKGS